MTRAAVASASTRVRVAWGERRHHLLRGGELGSLRRLQRAFADAVPGGQVLVGQLGARPRAALDEPRAQREQRVALVVRADRRRRAVGRLEVGARVAEEAHGAEVQDCGMAVLPHPGRELARGGEGRGRVVAVGPLDGELGAAEERLLDPALGRRDADPERVVLADEEDREARALRTR